MVAGIFTVCRRSRQRPCSIFGHRLARRTCKQRQSFDYGLPLSHSTAASNPSLHPVRARLVMCRCVLVCRTANDRRELRAAQSGRISATDSNRSSAISTVKTTMKIECNGLNQIIVVISRSGRVRRGGTQQALLSGLAVHRVFSPQSASREALARGACARPHTLCASRVRSEKPPGLALL